MLIEFFMFSKSLSIYAYTFLPTILLRLMSSCIPPNTNENQTNEIIRNKTNKTNLKFLRNNTHKTFPNVNKLFITTTINKFQKTTSKRTYQI